MTASTVLTGLGSVDLAAFLLRSLLGVFFVLARFRWYYDPSRPEQPVFNPARHRHLLQKLCSCGYTATPILGAFIAFVEVFGGLALILGVLTRLAAVGILCLLLCATYCTARAKIYEQCPVDVIDCCSCYLWRVEGIYLTLAIVILIIGPGAFSFDAIVLAEVLR